MKRKVLLLMNLMVIVGVGIGLILMMTNKSDDFSNLDLQEVREIAWNSIEKGQIPHITSNKNEAVVSLIDSKDNWIVPINDEQKKELNKIKDLKTLITVTFNTDRDGLLGPIIAVINPATMKVIGFYPLM